MAQTDQKDESWTWTQVKSKHKSRRQHQAEAKDDDKEKDQEQEPRHFRSVSDIASEYRAVRAQWEDSACCRCLRERLGQGTAAGDQGTGVGIEIGKGSSSLRVSQGICLGIGSFDPPDGGWEAKRKTYIQLVAFLIIVEELEPVFTPNDRAFLTSLGHQVVDSPLACDAVDQDALLYGVHLYRPVYAMALRRSKPAVFVGTGWDVWDEVDMASEPGADLAHLRNMELEYRKFPFPQDATTTAFSSTSMYVRPPI